MTTAVPKRRDRFVIGRDYLRTYLRPTQQGTYLPTYLALDGGCVPVETSHGIMVPSLVVFRKAREREYRLFGPAVLPDQQVQPS